MKTLEIVYLDSDSKMVKEALRMSKFLRQKGVYSRLSGFIMESQGAFDAVLSMACEKPVIDAMILPAQHPRNSYVKGLEETRKHINAIKKFVRA